MKTKKISLEKLDVQKLDSKQLQGVLRGGGNVTLSLCQMGEEEDFGDIEFDVCD